MHTTIGLLFVLLGSFTGQSSTQPEWCRNLPRPQYRKLERVAAAGDWFEVYKIRPGVFAIYEPRQEEEVISYLITGEKQALLFDTGLGIGDIKKAGGRTHAAAGQRAQLAHPQ